MEETILSEFTVRKSLQCHEKKKKKKLALAAYEHLLNVMNTNVKS